ncbi:hypothetical protein TNCV_2354931 [Trichonephila clavipes]|nr:hypothetical protein TNCV_2354931 [Trichonephila clavipes]
MFAVCGVPVSVADKGWRVYPLEPHLDAVVLYSGCTPGKLRACVLPDDWHTASLVGLRGGWRPRQDEVVFRAYGSNAAVPGSPKLPTTIKTGFLNCKFRLYIPNHLRCYKCQRFGHFQTSRRGQLTCSRCASVGHSSTDCTLVSKCPPFCHDYIVIKSEPPNSVIDTVPTTSVNLYISAASSSSSACPVLETTTTTSNTITATSQEAKETSKLCRKKRPPKNTSNTIKPKIEIKMPSHRSRKSASMEYTTDEEDMIVYDEEDEPELNPKYVLNMKGFTYK